MDNKSLDQTFYDFDKDIEIKEKYKPKVYRCRIIKKSKSKDRNRKVKSSWGGTTNLIPNKRKEAQSQLKISRCRKIIDKNASRNSINFSKPSDQGNNNKMSI